MITFLLVIYYILIFISVIFGLWLTYALINWFSSLTRKNNVIIEKIELETKVLMNDNYELSEKETDQESSISENYINDNNLEYDMEFE